MESTMENKMESNFDVNKFVGLLLKPENRDKVKELRQETKTKIEQLNFSISTHQKRLDSLQLELASAKTDLQSPRLILAEIESYQRSLAQAKELIERCQSKIESLQAKLPVDIRQQTVDKLQADLSSEASTIESLSQAKSFYTKIKNWIDEAV